MLGMINLRFKIVVISGGENMGIRLENIWLDVCFSYYGFAKKVTRKV